MFAPRLLVVALGRGARGGPLFLDEPEGAYDAAAKGAGDSALLVMLTQKESAQLLEILSAAPFEAAAGTFQRTFVRADHFRVAAALCLMLDDDVLRPHHRLTAMYVIHDLYKNELPSVHPFMPFLVNTLQQSPQTDAKEAQPAERKLLCLLLAQPPSKDLPKKAPAELSSLGPAPLPNLQGLVRSYAERDKQVSTLRRDGVSPLVPHVSALELPSRGGGGPALDERLGLTRLQPPLLSPPPPLLDSREDEVLWLNPCSESSLKVTITPLCSPLPTPPRPAPAAARDGRRLAVNRAPLLPAAPRRPCPLRSPVFRRPVRRSPPQNRWRLHVGLPPSCRCCGTTRCARITSRESRCVP